MTSVLLVICLSDDDTDVDVIHHIDDINIHTSSTLNIPHVTSTNEQQSSSTTNELDLNTVNDLSHWIIKEKDILRIQALPSKYFDKYKGSFEIRCSTIRFGIVEFAVDGEVIQMKDIEFEMRLKGRSSSSSMNRHQVFRRLIIVELIFRWISRFGEN
jgi:hypothetical protein